MIEQDSVWDLEKEWSLLKKDVGTVRSDDLVALPAGWLLMEEILARMRF